MTVTRGVARVLALSVAAAGTSVAVEINGAGATTPAHVLQDWAKAYKGATVTYEAVGSGEGIKRVKAKEVAFGVSDMALSVPELETARLVQFPVLLGGIVPIVNVKGVAAGELRLSGPTLAGIYLGKIKVWNDPQLVALNPGVTLPADAIRPVHRAEKSGSSFVFTSYLTRASEEWKKSVGAELEVKWPAGEACEGSDGVVACVLKTPGAIGYVDAGRANQPGLASVRLKNRDGGFAAPTKRAFQAAAAAFPWSQAPAFSVTLVDQPGAESWPLAASVVVIMPLVVEEAQRAEAALRFFDWALREGGDAAEKHGFVPLPANLIDTVRGAWRRQIKTTTGEPVWRVR